MVAPVLDGLRPLLVEVQALVTRAAGVPVPRRWAQGLETSRVHLLLAVLDTRVRLRVADAEVYASVAGGMRIADTGMDLALLLAVAGAARGIAAPEGLVALGEVGLGGELRQASHTERRLAEAARLGFRRALVPRSAPSVRGIELVRVGSVREALDRLGWPTTGGDARPEVREGRRGA